MAGGLDVSGVEGMVEDIFKRKKRGKKRAVGRY